MKGQPVISLFFALMMLALISQTGCNTYRPIPTHGGGKRFDEEQRAVAAAIRNAIAHMDVSELKNHKVLINTVSLTHNGGGWVSFPGITSISGGGGNVSMDYDAAWRWGSQENFNANISFNPDTKLYPTVFGTDQDLTYLNAALEMKLRHDNVYVVAAGQEYTLNIIVNVLGINRSKKERVFNWQDKLSATCEVTYYAVNIADQSLLFRARNSAGQGLYAEDSSLALAGHTIERCHGTIAPVMTFPVTREDYMNIMEISHTLEPNEPPSKSNVPEISQPHPEPSSSLPESNAAVVPAPPTTSATVEQSPLNPDLPVVDPNTPDTATETTTTPSQ